MESLVAPEIQEVLRKQRLLSVVVLDVTSGCNGSEDLEGRSREPRGSLELLGRLVQLGVWCLFSGGMARSALPVLVDSRAF